MKANCGSINASQFLGAPLYLINKEWYNAWIAFTMQSWGLLTMTMTQWWAPTVVRVSGDSTMRGQLIQTTDGTLLCNFPERMFLIANHQIYTDWLYLWWIGYTAGMHGRIYVVLKESLKSIPVIGWGMQFAQFIFLKRKWEEDKPRLAQHMQRFKNDKPMWLMMFPEGTNLAPDTRESSKKWAAKNGIKDMEHMLLPRSTGLHFMLKELKGTVEYLYDCTIAYEGVPRGQYAQDIFTVGASYFGGRPPKSVNMYWRRFRVANIPTDDPQKFDAWLRARWSEKDRFIENWYRTGRFPADTGSSKDYQGRVSAGAGYIESEIKPQRWYEFLQVFAPIGLFALVLYVFYGSLPQEMIEKVKSIDQKTIVKQLDAIQKGQLKVPETKDLLATAPKHLQNRFDAVRKLAEARHTTPEKVIAELQGSNGANIFGKAANDVKQPKSLPKGKPTKLPGNPKPTKLPGNPNPAPEPANKPAKKLPAKTLPAKKLPATKLPAKKPKPSQPSTVGASNGPPGAKPAKLGPKSQSSTTSAKQPDTTRKPSIAPTEANSLNGATSKAANVKGNPSSLVSQPTVQHKNNNDLADTPDESEPASAEIRKARKKLEYRQGRQLPPRKIKRTLATKD